MVGPVSSQEEVRVLDGGEPVEVAALARIRLPDGRPGVVWRGQAFPLAADGSIDIAGPYATPAECTPWRPLATDWSLVEGEEECALLVSGGALERDRVAAALRAEGIAVLRSYPVLDPALEADWVVRIARPRGSPDPVERITAVLGSAMHTERGESTDLRLRLLEARLADLVAERDRLRAELAALRDASSRARPSSADVGQQGELEQARARIAELEGRLASARPEPRPPVPFEQPAERLGKRLRAEVEDVLAAFPRLTLVADSLLTLVTDFRDRRAVYRVLAALDRGEPLQPRFKPVRGREGWHECHVGTGHDDSGRIYVARAADGAWLVLVSVKEQQRRDIERLRELARRAEP